MTVVRHALVLAAKDLRLELRTRHAMTLTVMTGLLVVVVLALGLGTGRAGHPLGAGAILWTAFIFGGTLCFEKTMLAEREDDAMAALLLAPIDRSSIFLGKLLANMALLLVLVLVVTPAGMLLLRLDLSGVAVEFGVVVLLSIVGFAAVGTLFAAAVGGGRRRSGVLALALLPLCLPLVLVSTHLLDGATAHAPGSKQGVPILVAFDAIFLAAGWLAFDACLEPRGAS